MTSITKKEKICKCGHLQTEHMKNPHSILKLTQHCHSCHCNEYMNRNKPTLSDTLLMVVSLGWLILFVGITISLGVITYYGIPIEDLDKPLENVTTGDYLTLLILLLVIICILFYMMLEEPIFGYFRERKRPTYT